MSKTRKKKSLRGFFSGDKGQRTFNYAYSIGASVVILGSLFKILHLPGADLMLIVGMGTEAAIFFLSSFDEPAKDYKWENVFPVLDDPNATPSQAPSFSREGVGNGTVIIGNIPEDGVLSVHGCVASADGDAASASVTRVGDAGCGAEAGVASSAASAIFTPESASELNAATENYVRQINEMTEQLTLLKGITASLNEAQTSLLASYDSLKGNDGATAGYVEQMQQLNRNIAGLNTVYEIQLKNVGAQLDTIDKVNMGLNNIRAMYENGSNDSFRIRQETERMTQTLSQLNAIYERMLQAMTVNMGFSARPAQSYGQQPAGFAAAQQQSPYPAAQQAPSFQQPAYGGGAPYNGAQVNSQG